MTDRIEDGGPAFAHGDPTHGGEPGMALRDWFAGQALASFCYDVLPHNAGRLAYEYADAMLEART